LGVIAPVGASIKGIRARRLLGISVLQKRLKKDDTMTKVSTSEGKLVIDVEGLDKLWAFKSRLEIPLNHISGVRSGADEHAEGIRAPGTHFPGIIAAGTFRQIGKKVFWDVHHLERAIAIDLHHDSYSMLVIEVADPEATIREIQKAIASAKA